MFAASLDLMNWLHRKKTTIMDLYESASAGRKRQRKREGEGWRRKDRRRKGRREE